MANLSKLKRDKMIQFLQELKFQHNDDNSIRVINELENHLIECEIIKLEPNMTKKGCAYGVKFQCINLYAAKDALDKSSVKYTEIISL